MDVQPALEVAIAEDGSVHISGVAAVETLLRLALAAKFQTELSSDHLLSPYLNRLIDELTKVLPVEPTDWANPSVLTPPSFKEAVGVMRRYRDLHEPGADLSELIRVALKPFDVPADRIGL